MGENSIVFWSIGIPFHKLSYKSNSKMVSIYMKTTWLEKHGHSCSVLRTSHSAQFFKFWTVLRTVQRPI